MTKANNTRRGSRTFGPTPPTAGPRSRPTPSTGGAAPRNAPRAPVLCGLLLAGAAVFALDWDWPSADAAVTANFGGNNNGIPRLGTVFAGEGPVRASGAGEVIFVNSTSAASRIPSPLGAWIAIDHGDGLISIYSHLQEPPAAPVPEQPEQGRVIASPGQSGWADRQGFSFAFFDRKERRWINPSMIIAPPVDTTAPVIHSVALLDADGRVFDLAQTRTLGQGRYTVFVHATDPVSPLPARTAAAALPNSLAPYRIQCFLNGQETGALAFEVISARNGTLMVSRNGLVPVRQVYARYPAIEIGELRFTRGQAALEIVARDILGNSQSAAFRLQVD